MKAQVGAKWRQGKVWRNDEAGVNQSEAPVQNADDNLNRGGNEGQVVLGSEEVVGHGLRR